MAISLWFAANMWRAVFEYPTMEACAEHTARQMIIYPEIKTAFCCMPDQVCKEIRVVDNQLSAIYRLHAKPEVSSILEARKRDQ